MAVNEEIVTGRKFRKLIDEATKLWQRISFWTKASDVEFDDGQTAETKVGAINGITDSLVSTSSNIAASAKALSTVNNKLANGRVNIVVTETGLGYKIDGADTVTPFSKIPVFGTFTTPDSGYTKDVNVGFKPNNIVVFVWDIREKETPSYFSFMYKLFDGKTYHSDRCQNTPYKASEGNGFDNWMINDFTDNGFIFKTNNSAGNGKTARYLCW